MAGLSRKTVLVLAALYVETFKMPAYRRSKFAEDHVVIDTKALYECAYAHNCDSWLCTHLEYQRKESVLRPFILKLHTGESVNNDQWTLPQRATYGQAKLLELCVAILSAGPETLDDADRNALRSALELDGYVFRDGRLLPSEGETQDVDAERGELMQLYASLGLPNAATVRDCLEASERNYVEGHYRDCISNARHYAEQILHDVADAWNARPGTPDLVIGANQPAAGPCRNYLHDVGVLTTDEREVFRTLHGLLSGTGGHPNIAERDEARVFRRLATSMSLYLMLSYQALR